MSTSGISISVSVEGPVIVNELCSKSPRFAAVGENDT